MSKAKTLSAIIAGLFTNSDKAISEKLSSEEYASFSQEASDLNTKLEAQVTLNEQLTAQVSDLTTKLEAANTLAESRAAEITTVTNERNTFKTHYDKAAAQGTGTADRDENSHGKVETSSYNANALEVYHKAHGK
jgi:peptidoglycan hydrolase CwlO-like protein